MHRTVLTLLFLGYVVSIRSGPAGLSESSDEGSSNRLCKACRWDIDVGLRVYVLLIFRDEIRYLSHDASQTLLGLEQI